MERTGSGPSVAPHTEYAHARLRCPACGASVPADRTGSDGRCESCWAR